MFAEHVGYVDVVRFAVLAIVACACHTDPAPTGPDASTPETDGGGVVPSGGEYWPCYFWDNDATKCSPKCANKTLLGREVFGEHNTCDTSSGKCPTADMTASAATPGAGCCVYANKRVQFVPCE